MAFDHYDCSLAGISTIVTSDDLISLLVSVVMEIVQNILPSLTKTSFCDQCRNAVPGC